MDRNQQLLQKMQEINNNFNVKTNKYYTASTDSLENKLEMIKKKMQNTIEKNKEELVGLLKDANQLYEKVERNNREYENEAKIQIQKLRDFEEKFSKKIQIEILERKERQHAIITQFEDKAEALRRQIQKQVKIRENLFSQVTGTLENDLPSIMAQLNEAKLEFEAVEDQIVKQSNELIDESEKYLKQFTAEQEANSNKAFQLIRDLTKKIKTQIEQQKSACEATHEEVFAYVEETCNKLVQI